MAGPMRCHGTLSPVGTLQIDRKGVGSLGEATMLRIVLNTGFSWNVQVHHDAREPAWGGQDEPEEFQEMVSGHLVHRTLRRIYR